MFRAMNIDNAAPALAPAVDIPEVPAAVLTRQCTLMGYIPTYGVCRHGSR